MSFQRKVKRRRNKLRYGEDLRRATAIAKRSGMTVDEVLRAAELEAARSKDDDRR